MRYSVRVPATSANLGPGFDSLGLALALYADFTVELSQPFSILVEGEGAATIAHNQRNLAYRTIVGALAEVGIATPSFRLTIRNGIPLSGGLGSSSAAIVAGLILADAIAGRERSNLLRVADAARIEGHPDNVSPALLGGFVAAMMGAEYVTAIRIPLAMKPQAVLFAPEFSIRTSRARQALPRLVPHADAAFNVGHTAVLVAALREGRFDLLGRAMDDRLHQESRARTFPAMFEIIDAARTAGAFGACLSGSGSAILALTDDRAVAVGEVMADSARARGVGGRVIIVPIDEGGADLRQV